MGSLRLQKQNGFTIVELLIVIVIIAILATISIVAYSGIQDRTEASKTAVAVQAYTNALKMYRIDNGSYPATGAFCLGDQYGVFSGGATASCRNSASPITAAGNAAARDGLRPYLGGQLPMPSTKFIVAGTGTEYVGGHFYGSSYNYTLDGSPVAALEYYIHSTTCPVGPVYSTAGSPNFSSPAVSRTSAIGSGSRCFMLLPNG